MRSITHRLVVVLLLSEFLLTVTVTAINLGYERSQRYKSFDVMLRGRADSVLAAVEVDEDSETLVLNGKAVEVPAGDRYEVVLDSGATLGHSANWTALPKELWARPDGIQKFHLDGMRYRRAMAHGFRTLDPDNGPKETLGVSVFYASATTPVTEALLHGAEFLVLANLLVLAVSGVFAAALVRRGIEPLQELAVAASGITSTSWRFAAPESAKSVRELRGLSDALEMTLQGLERSFVQQQTFIHDAAHELKTAVTIIKSSLQLLIYRPRTTTEYQSGIEACLTDCGRMEELVYKMLTLAQLEQQATQGRLREVTVRDRLEALQQVIEQLRPVADLRSVEIVERLAPTLVTQVSTEEWSTLAMNLILNAIQHSPTGSAVEVTTESTEDAVVLRVRDAGDGIAPESIPLVFDRFYRGDASRARTTGGTGLGLAICKAIVEFNGGEISVASELGVGTTVAVRFPRRVG